MTILILGSEGFIGSHLVDHFAGQRNTVVGCDLVSQPKNNNYKYVINTGAADFYTTLFSAQQFDVCINASGSGNVSYSIQQPVKDFQANCGDVIKVLDAIREGSPSCKYLHISSAAVYGNPVTLPVSEDAELKPLSPYGWHKLISEQICKEYYELYKLNIAIIRPFSVYGNGLQKQLLWDICQKLDSADEISLFGTGKESRDFIHISDLMDVIGRIISNCDFNCNIYNAASGTEVSIAEIADMFMQHFRGDKKISFSGEAKQGDPISWRADVNRISTLGFQPNIIMKQAITSYIDWYQKQVNG